MNTDSGKVKLALLLVSCLTIMSMITISASLPDMADTFSDIPKGKKLVKLVLSFPGLFIALSAIFAGIVIDKFGRLKLLSVALVIYAIAGSSGYWLKNIYLILTGRALLGICVGITMTIATTLVADYYQGKERQKFAGIQIAVMSLGGIIFITLGGILADISWRVPFLLYLFSLLIIPFTYLFLKEPNKNVEAKSDVKRTKSPRTIWFVFVNIMLMWILFFIIPIQIPFYLKSIGVEKNALIGIAVASSTFFSAIGAISFSKIKDTFSFKQIFGFGYLLMALSFFCITYGDSYNSVMMAMILAGLGMGVMIPNANVWVMQLAPPEIRGREIGRLTTFWFMGQFLSPIIFIPFLDWLTQAQLFFMISCFLLVLSILMFSFGYIKSEKI
ncbi:MFS transporter [Aureisphaera galaxeae]|uniref:MFS transporter n=1 Tax=Aureisphaera galaxeae TaxID=1538023 RepID=UPI00234FFFBD|nr:MFS transporter [Aureisphaera galaxeae]MDC8003410.1 MFS transporter [Aureisphaera galaxeae]